MSPGFATIDLTWTGPASLRILVDPLSLEWTLTASETPTLRFVNAVSVRLPIWTWRPGVLLRVRERLAHRLGMGHLQLSGVMPSGHIGTLMPQRMYFVEESTATLDGGGSRTTDALRPQPGHWRRGAAGPRRVGHRTGDVEDPRLRRVPAHQERNRRSRSGTKTHQGLIEKDRSITRHGGPG